MKIFIVGQNKGELEWEFQGAFTSKEKAIAACKTKDYWWGETDLDKELPEETIKWESYGYPLMNPSPVSYTFEQFVEFGKQNGANIVGGMPWSFNFYGATVTHENDKLYLIAGTEGPYKKFHEGQIIYPSMDGNHIIV